MSASNTVKKKEKKKQEKDKIMEQSIANACEKAEGSFLQFLVSCSYFE